MLTLAQKRKITRGKKSKHVQQLAGGASVACVGFLQATADETVADEATKSDEAILLEEIRDLLKKQK